MPRHVVRTEELTAVLRECWVDKNNYLISCENESVLHAKTIHAIVLESVKVEPRHRRRGFCRRLIEALCLDSRYDLVIIEGVQNRHLADALLRWGWDHDPRVMDFYRRKT
jgi:hypothetical protein